LASGYKARIGDSLHGGIATTGVAIPLLVAAGSDTHARSRAGTAEVLREAAGSLPGQHGSNQGE